jgi:proteic killer suppression protein
LIRSFKGKWVEQLLVGHAPKGFPADLVRNTRQRLAYLDGAKVLDDLRSPPGNRLEALKGDRAGQHSIRINDQWRICFRWSSGGADDVEVVDYH